MDDTICFHCGKEIRNYTKMKEHLAEHEKSELRHCTKCNVLCDVPDVDMCKDCHNEAMESRPSMTNRERHKIIDVRYAEPIADHIGAMTLVFENPDNFKAFKEWLYSDSEYEENGTND